MRRLSGILAGGLLVALTAGPAFGQADTWKGKWFWGGQVGVVKFWLPTTKNDVGLTVGGHWLITATRSALFLGIDQIFYPDNAGSTIGTTQVSFNSGRRIQAQLLAIPIDGPLQLWVGGGFGIHHITDIRGVQSASPDVQNEIEEASSGAFAVGTVGIQLRFGPRWAFYGAYQYVPANDGYLIQSELHSLTAGLRVALGSAHETVTTRP